MTFDRLILIACMFILLPMRKKPALVVGGIGNEISYTIEEKALWNS